MRGRSGRVQLVVTDQILIFGEWFNGFVLLKNFIVKRLDRLLRLFQLKRNKKVFNTTDLFLRNIHIYILYNSTKNQG